MHPTLLISIPIILFLIVFAATKLAYGFWYYQPVYHLYDLHYAFTSNRVIQPDLPKKTKFFHPDVKVKVIESSDVSLFSSLVSFVAKEYYKKPPYHFQPSVGQMAPYFQSHNYPSFVSLLYEPTLIQNGVSGEIQESKNNPLKAIMTTRPLYVTLYDNKGRLKDDFPVYYADYLCVSHASRKKGTAPQMIQTHEYEQRHAVPAIQVSLFKREGRLTGIKPLCVYPMFCFSCAKWNKPVPLPPGIEIVVCNKTNYRFLHDFLGDDTIRQLRIIPALGNLFALIDSGNLFVYMLVDKGNERVRSAYFFKNTAMVFDPSGKTGLMCMGSIAKDPKTPDFVAGFKNAFWDILQQDNKKNEKEKNNFGYCIVESLSDNGTIIDSIRKKTRPLFTSYAAFYFYNYVHRTIQPQKALIIY